MPPRPWHQRLLRHAVAAGFVVGVALASAPAFAGTLSCTVATTCPSGVVVMRLSDTTNAHAELPGQSNYTQLVCCSGVVGLTNSCSGTFATVAKLSGTTNAHIEQNNQSNYSESVCLGAPDGGTVSVGYQSTNCTGFDTTVASMSAVTNAHAGNASNYTTKICATSAAAGGALTVDIVDAGGTPVSSPSMAMGAVTFSFPFQTASGTFGTAAQKIRVDNSTGSAQWTLTMAASVGTTALWSAGTPTYDFNDPTANAVDGGDADNRGGRLSINPAVATITPGGGCSTTGLTLGSSAGFSEGVTDSLTILTAGASADPTCVWDITGLGISQTIPAEQSAGSYAITMVLSVVAS